MPAASCHSSSGSACVASTRLRRHARKRSNMVAAPFSLVVWRPLLARFQRKRPVGIGIQLPERPHRIAGLARELSAFQLDALDLAEAAADLATRDVDLLYILVRLADVRGELGHPVLEQAEVLR